MRHVGLEPAPVIKSKKNALDTHLKKPRKVLRKRWEWRSTGIPIGYCVLEGLDTELDTAAVTAVESSAAARLDTKSKFQIAMLFE